MNRSGTNCVLVLAALLLTGCCLIAEHAEASESLEMLLGRAHRLATQKDFVAAEAVSRDAVARWPESHDALRILANVLLWEGRNREARELFERLLSLDPRDVESWLGLARSFYWSGDYRMAMHEFERALEIDSRNEEARRGIDEIRAGMRSGYSIEGAFLDDDQPYRAAGGVVRGYFFSDPLTKWELLAGGSSLDAADAREKTLASTVAVETSFASIRTKLRAEAGYFRFPDDTASFFPSIRVERQLETTRVELAAERRALLRDAAAIGNHPSADVVSAGWFREDDRPLQFAIRGEYLSYFDDNRSWGADGYALLLARRTESSTIRAGGSIAFRDTGESRFRPTGPGASAGIYDPYWTPQELVEGRLVTAASFTPGSATLSIHLDGGVARDRTRSFPSPSTVAEFDRTYYPWRASATVSCHSSSATTLSITVAHETTVDYESNEIRASLAGRF